MWGAVRSINGVAPRLRGEDVWNPDFTRMLDALSRLQRSRALGIVSSRESGGAPVLKFRVAPGDQRSAEALATLRELWRLSPGKDEYRIVLGVVPRDAEEIAVFTIRVPLPGPSGPPDQHQGVARGVAASWDYQLPLARSAAYLGNLAAAGRNANA